MIDIDKTFLIQLVNFLITIVGLNLLLIRPIRDMIQERNTLMADQVGKIEGFNSSAEEKLKSYQAAIDAARQEGLEVRKLMRAEGTGEEQQIMAAAGKEVSTTLKAAHEDIAAQVAGAKQALFADVEKFAQKATAKILGQA
ncbi:MAG: ATP synthase F0 subunit B [Proteobacteria bacterium]|nr:ATP synthase F0 subunit B [Pseudomonadota bacterium]MBU1596333.1 ATP synthase F0 subunit B [Pseudomonadota bacterium]